MQDITQATGNTQPIQAVLFDLDGTLMASACDLGIALNQLLMEHHRTPVDQKALEGIISLGSAEHIKLGFSITMDHPDYSSLKERFFDLYEIQLKQRCTTPLYDGTRFLLNTLKEKRLPWGVVTNKYHRFADTLMQYHQLDGQCAVLITPEDVSRGKPSPEPLLKACKTIDCQPDACIYIGDHERDILAGKRACMTTIAAAYGYIDTDDNPKHWQADFIANKPTDILHWLQKNEWQVKINDKLAKP